MPVSPVLSMTGRPVKHRKLLDDVFHGARVSVIIWLRPVTSPRPETMASGGLSLGLRSVLADDHREYGDLGRFTMDPQFEAVGEQAIAASGGTRRSAEGCRPRLSPRYRKMFRRGQYRASAQAS